MDLYLIIPGDFFTDEERQKLEQLFGIDTSAEDRDEQFRQAINNIVLAGLDEYRSMLLGIGLPSRADEIRQHRLFYLIKHYFQGRLPTEAEVSSMFQLTQSQSRGLIRSVMARFRYELEAEIRNTLAAHVRNANLYEDGVIREYRVVIQSKYVLDELNRIVGGIAPNLDQIRKVRNTSSTYAISEDTYQKLREHFQL